MIQPLNIQELLKPFGISLSGDQPDRLFTYLELLLKWNAKINLVGQASDENCATRHFGESLFLSSLLPLNGRLLDIGSGAGFPGLALKITSPDLKVTLLEPVAKKRAFLKEVTRVCQFAQVAVLADRFEHFAAQLTESKYDYSTARAVGGFSQLIRNAATCLSPGGKICLWVGREDGAKIVQSQSPFRWQTPAPIPLSREREILIGELQSSL